MENRFEEYQNFLHKLQLEYLTQRLRYLTYRDEKYKDFALKVAENKVIKIQSVGEKFGLETIFSGVPVQDFVKRYFWNEYGLPNFQYRDEAQRGVQWNYDAWYILFRGTEVVCSGQLCYIKKNNPKLEQVEIFDGLSTVEKAYSEIQLIDKYQWI